mmetsp:Transcript_15455/g.38467  ORF Transcript_15455/g.38467 Transcript_15455/m.38467 type:complete len:229 (+) Transcript_15455:1714-2400(+)
MYFRSVDLPTPFSPIRPYRRRCANFNSLLSIRTVPLSRLTVTPLTCISLRLSFVPCPVLRSLSNFILTNPPPINASTSTSCFDDKSLRAFSNSFLRALRLSFELANDSSFVSYASIKVLCIATTLEASFPPPIPTEAIISSSPAATPRRSPRSPDKSEDILTTPCASLRVVLVDVLVWLEEALAVKVCNKKSFIFVCAAVWISDGQPTDSKNGTKTSSNASSTNSVWF